MSPKALPGGKELQATVGRPSPGRPSLEHLGPPFPSLASTRTRSNSFTHAL